jgi:hypothetical protein
MSGSRKTALIREVNDGIDHMLHRFGQEDEARFFCECPSMLCGRRVVMTASHFDEIRARGDLVLAPGCAAATPVRLAAV